MKAEDPVFRPASLIKVLHGEDKHIRYFHIHIKIHKINNLHRKTTWTWHKKNQLQSNTTVPQVMAGKRQFS